jgi:hypothetical protein
MPLRPRYLIFIIAIFIVSNCFLLTASAQNRGRRPSKAAIPAVPASKDDKWWGAQRNIEAAIQQLEAYLRENPNGPRSATARQQLEVLRSLSISASRPEWVKMDAVGVLEIPEWRVASVELLSDKTRLSIEIRCDRDDGGDCWFLPFDRAPLVLVDNAGRYYPMIESEPLPSNVKHRTDGRAVITSGRIVTLTVDFAPLGARSVSGQIYYRDNNQAKPAVFRLLAPSK